jgi:hypothetical protein
LELTFGFRKVNDVPFTNAAAYLVNTGKKYFITDDYEFKELF